MNNNSNNNTLNFEKVNDVGMLKANVKQNSANDRIPQGQLRIYFI